MGEIIKLQSQFKVRGQVSTQYHFSSAHVSHLLLLSVDLGYVHLEAAATAQMLATKHAAEALPGVGVSVEDVHLEVPLLAGADVGAVGAVPASESLHHHHIGQTILI